METSHDDISCTSDSQETPVPLASPQSSVIKEVRSLSACSSHDETPSKPSRMEKYRKRQLEIEEEKLQQLKKLCSAIEERNEIQKEKLAVLIQLAATRQSS